MTDSTEADIVAERLWCTACGTVTRDRVCDCNDYPEGHEMRREPHFVNYADQVNSDFMECRKELLETQAEITKLRAERARCVGLCNMMAEKLQNRAVEIRAARTFTSRSLWPPFRKQFFVMPGAETGAQQHDEAARIVRSIAKAIDAGWPLDEVAIGKAEASSVMATERGGA